MTPNLRELVSSPVAFGRWAFKGCAQQGRTLDHLGTCVAARLHDGRRKTHQPSGRRLALEPDDSDAVRQRINRAYLKEWSDAVVRERLRGVLAESVAAPLAWVIDDTSIVKKGVKSPGVHRQYTGTAGKNENCQIVVSTHLAGHDGSGPVAMDLYLPKVWCEDTARRTEAWIPTQVSFRTKLDIALAQLDHLQAVGESNRVVLADAGYGKSTTFRVELDARGLDFIVGVPGAQHLWRVGQGPDPPPIVPGGPGRPKTRSLPGTYKTISITDLVRELEPSEWKVIDLRPATPGVRTSRFAFVRGVRSAHGASKGRLPGPHRVLIAEWPDGDNKPSHYFIASANAQSDDADLARLAKLRWRVERDYQDLKQEVGLTHYEGRRWPGFHHHLTVCMAAITYLIAARATSPPG